MNRRTLSGKDFGIHLLGTKIEDHALGAPAEGDEIVEAQCLIYPSNRCITWPSTDKFLSRHRGAVREPANAVIRFRSEQLLRMMCSLDDVTKCRVWITEEVGRCSQQPDRATSFTVFGATLVPANLNPEKSKHCIFSLHPSFCAGITYRGRRQLHRCCPMVQTQPCIHSLHIVL